MAKRGSKHIEVPRGKLIGQNGPGSLYVDTEGISYVISAADKWFSSHKRINIQKMELNEPRLEMLLGVKNFREVPEYISSFGFEKKENTGVSIPLQRFPLVHYCTKCGYFKKFYPVNGLKTSYCSRCDKDTVFTQFPIVIVCGSGHMMDFPYFRYTHVKDNYSQETEHSVRVIREGSSILNWTLKCDCGLSHSLSGVTGQGNGESLTPFQKEMGGHAKCFGHKPWTGDKLEEECEEKPTAILRNSISNYNAETISALSISTNSTVSESSYEEIKSDEFSRLTLKITEEKEKLDVQNSFYSENTVIKNVNYVFRLEEIVVQTGFHRLSPSDEAQNWLRVSQNKGRNMLFSDDVKIPDWYPAKKQYGEGVFVEFNTDILKGWSQHPQVIKRQRNCMDRVSEFYLATSFSSAIEVMIHTFSHAMIHQFSLKSGYPITAIRERLYSENDEYGLLLYVTDSDKDGTFGGLVRLADEQKFKLNTNAALKRLDWCSSDPVCFELGNDFGQGFHNSNGSACHNCSFVPDTACSYRNCFLDRDYIGRTDSDTSITRFAEIFE
ncbi:Zn-binding domain-containing protein [Jeotgalibaca porci]|uniref:Zn-binding domain-containing protein n=1 Tax=Jeotgalibaca porci TaxID=1868793 RepID=UPI003F8F03F0